MKKIMLKNLIVGKVVEFYQVTNSSSIVGHYMNNIIIGSCNPFCSNFKVIYKTTNETILDCKFYCDLDIYFNIDVIRDYDKKYINKKNEIYTNKLLDDLSTSSITKESKHYYIQGKTYNYIMYRCDINGTNDCKWDIIVKDRFKKVADYPYYDMDSKLIKAINEIGYYEEVTFDTVKDIIKSQIVKDFTMDDSVDDSVIITLANDDKIKINSAGNEYGSIYFQYNMAYKTESELITDEIDKNIIKDLIINKNNIDHIMAVLLSDKSHIEKIEDSYVLTMDNFKYTITQISSNMFGTAYDIEIINEEQYTIDYKFTYNDSIQNILSELIKRKYNGT